MLYDETITQEIQKVDYKISGISQEKYTHFLVILYPVLGNDYIDKFQKFRIGASLIGGTIEYEEFQGTFGITMERLPIAMELYRDPKTGVFIMNYKNHQNRGAALTARMNNIRIESQFPENWRPGTRFVIKGW